jgi:hypothetical protein
MVDLRETEVRRAERPALQLAQRDVRGNHAGLHTLEELTKVGFSHGKGNGRTRGSVQEARLVPPPVR